MSDSINSLFRLDGKIALVTGASSGLGWHFAKVLAKAGAHVVVAARRKQRLQALCDEIAADGGKASAVTLMSPTTRVSRLALMRARKPRACPMWF